MTNSKWLPISLIVLVLGACGGSSSSTDMDASLPPGDPVTQDTLVKACVVAGSCLGDGINDCFTDIVPFYPPATLRCFANAGNSCTAAFACLGATVATDPNCTGGVTTCDGNKTVQCDPPIKVSTECGAIGTSGPTCIAGANGRAECGVSTCTADSRACNGNAMETCDASRGVLESVDCGDYDQACVNGVCTSPGGGGACTNSAKRCAGSAVAECSDGVEAFTDCASRIEGASCAEVTTPFPDAYCSLGTQCYPEKGAETCTGASVNICAAGISTTFDCTTLGFTGCFAGRCRQ